MEEPCVGDVEDAPLDTPVLLEDDTTKIDKQGEETLESIIPVSTERLLDEDEKIDSNVQFESKEEEIASKELDELVSKELESLPVIEKEFCESNENADKQINVACTEKESKSEEVSAPAPLIEESNFAVDNPMPEEEKELIPLIDEPKFANEEPPSVTEESIHIEQSTPETNKTIIEEKLSHVEDELAEVPKIELQVTETFTEIKDETDPAPDIDNLVKEGRAEIEKLDLKENIDVNTESAAEDEEKPSESLNEHTSDVQNSNDVQKDLDLDNIISGTEPKDDEVSALDDKEKSNEKDADDSENNTSLEQQNLPEHVSVPCASSGNGDSESSMDLDFKNNRDVFSDETEELNITKKENCLDENNETPMEVCMTSDVINQNGLEAGSDPICNWETDGKTETMDIDDIQDTEEQNNEKNAEDHTQVSDPFVDLIADKTESVPELPDLNESSCVNNDNDGEADLEDDQAHMTDESICDNTSVTDIDQGQGADEEICLLPDTEREISEADKLKALAAKKTVSTDNLFDLLKDNESEVVENSKETPTELNNDSPGTVVEDQSTEQGADEDTEEVESMRELPDGEKEDEPEHIVDETIDPDIIQEIIKISQHCHSCGENKDCLYRLLVDGEMKYICNKGCVNNFQATLSNKYKIVHRKVVVSEVLPLVSVCFYCREEKKCYYKFTSAEEVKMLCQKECLQKVIGDNIEKYKMRRKKKFISEMAEKEALCFICLETKMCSYETVIEGNDKYVCNNDCFDELQRLQPTVFRLRKRKITKSKQPLLKLKVITNATDKYLDVGNKVIAKTAEEAEEARIDREKSFFRKCAQCSDPYVGNDKNLSWETMDFCNEICLGKYQNTHGLHCANCKNAVSMVSLGKYCVRFGYDIRQFCCSGCLDEFKKGLKICCYCQKDISNGFEGFLAPVGDQGQFKDFCSQFCVEKFDQMSKNPIPPPIWAQCAVCSKEKLTQLEVAIDDLHPLRLCSEPCFAAFKYVNNVFPDQCRWCKKYFERKSSESYTIYTDAAAHCFCSKTCMNVYISNSRHIVPCNWCKVKKYNFDMIKKTLDNGQSMMMCSLNCLTLYQVSVNAVSSRRIKCDQCKRFSQAQYHLTMSDATVRNFCTYQCVMSFQRQYSKTPMVLEGDSHNKQAVPTGAPRRTYSTQKNNVKTITKKLTGRSNNLPVISNVQSLAPPSPVSPVQQSTGHATRAKSKRLLEKPPPPPSPSPPPEPPKPATPPPPPPPQIYNHVLIQPPPPKKVKNMSTMVKSLMITKGVTCKPHMCSKEVQTDDSLQKRILIPIPVPIYVPTPMAMYSLPFPVPIPIPLPIPVPVFIPTTRNSANGIMKEIKKIHDKMPTDPFEAELLMMAEMVAGEKKKCESDSESDEENGDDGFSPDAMDTGNSAFGEDVLQMALKMATEYDEPAVDLESAMTASTITPSSHPTMQGLDENNPMHHHQLMMIEQQRVAAAVSASNSNSVARKRPSQGGTSPINATAPTRPPKRSRRAPDPPPPTHHAPPEPPREPQEKPDANMCLKYTFGVNAWKQWVMTKNAEMEKSTLRRKPFKSEILQLTADELNYSLCLFVKEVRKPNGSEYAPDTIYYLVLGIQQYLFENGRIDNIFTDSYYEKFTECLDEVARKFSVLYNDSQYIVTRVEEEHLWESKQLGAHSPHVLLSTLMFFNTKHFNLVTVDEHMQLSFSHIMKHWKRNPNQPGAAKIPGARNVLLRFYPPQSALEANSRKKKVYEQQENEENPLRCPVKLYEFYISKCPESVKTRNDVFYLMPERSCVPDSPVWYSTQALGREPLSKMLHRVKMVKEINIALLTS